MMKNISNWHISFKSEYLKDNKLQAGEKLATFFLVKKKRGEDINFLIMLELLLKFFFRNFHLNRRWVKKKKKVFIKKKTLEGTVLLRGMCITKPDNFLLRKNKWVEKFFVFSTLGDIHLKKKLLGLVPSHLTKHGALRFSKPLLAPKTLQNEINHHFRVSEKDNKRLCSRPWPVYYI